MSYAAVTEGMKKTALTNRIKKMSRSANSLTFDLDNIKINGDVRGCSGFITNNDTGVIVYVDTESTLSYRPHNEMMFRQARHDKDYRGLRNRWSGLDTYVIDVIKLLDGEGAE